jgi:hypothetical protein
MNMDSTFYIGTRILSFIFILLLLKYDILTRFTFYM